MDGRVDRFIGILEPLQASHAKTRENLEIPGMRPAAAHGFRDKAHKNDVFAANGIPCARHHRCPHAEEAHANGRSSGYALVVKPPAGAGA